MSRDFPGSSDGKESTCNAGDPLEKETATHSSILAWYTSFKSGAMVTLKAPWQPKPGDNFMD